MIWKNFLEFDSLFNTVTNGPLFIKLEVDYRGDKEDTVIMTRIINPCKRMDDFRQRMPKIGFFQVAGENRKLSDLTIFEFANSSIVINREMSIIVEVLFEELNRTGYYAECDFYDVLNERYLKLSESKEE